MNITGFIKKRIFLIGCVGLTLAGLGIFAAGMLIASSNAQSLNELEQTCSAIGGLKRKLVHENELVQLKQNAELAEADLAKVLALVQDTSKRPLLSQDVFPRPKDAYSAGYLYKKFAENYTNFVDQLRLSMGAGERPTEAERDAAIEQLVKSAAGGAGRSTTWNTTNLFDKGGAYGRRLSSEQRQMRKLIEELRRHKAENMKVYAPADAFCCYTYWRGQPELEMEAMIKESWLTQLATWIQEDVAQAITQMNAESGNVLTSPVKRLVAVRFAGESPTGQATRVVGKSASPSRLAADQGEGSEALPAYYDEAAAESEYTKAYTGRLSDELIDVVHFDVIVVMEDSRISDFINALQGPKVTGAGNYLRAQITVLGLTAQAVDLDSHAKDGYYYGSGALKRVVLPCEYFFFKKGYEPYKPSLFSEDETSGGSGSKKKGSGFGTY